MNGNLPCSYKETLGEGEIQCEIQSEQGVLSYGLN